MAKHWMRLSVVPAACLMLLGPIQSASAIGVLEAYIAALKNDPSHRAAKAELIAGLEYEAIGRSSLLPSAQYVYSTSKNKGESISPFLGTFTKSNQDYSSTSKSVSVRQTIFNLEAYARFEQGVAQKNYSIAQFDSRSSDLMVRLLTAYVETRYAEDQLNLYTAQRDSYAEQRKVNDRLYAKGEGTKTEMLETQAKLDVAEAMRLEAIDTLQTARNNLEAIVGVDVKQLDGLPVDFKPMLDSEDFDTWKRYAEEKNPEIIAAKYGIDIAQKEISKSQAGHAPRIELNANYNHGVSETFATKNQDLNMRTVGVQLIIPIYSGGYVNATSKQAVARLDKARADLDGTVSKVMVELRKQFSAVKSSVVKIEGLQKSVNSATALVEATQQSIKGGVRINADLLNAQQQLVAAKRDLASARYNYLLSYLKLRVAAGTVNIDDLRTVAGYFSEKN
ncbi:TolC family outer membrane protein [Undibacterium danionis]|uniref:TolC family outer membrane protein n=1 Tax=Undibacterium danionis TaxID=1812100 RepID=A0ABV6IH61_9BURK